MDDGRLDGADQDCAQERAQDRPATADDGGAADTQAAITDISMP